MLSLANQQAFSERFSNQKKSSLYSNYPAGGKTGVCQQGEQFTVILHHASRVRHEVLSTGPP